MVAILCAVCLLIGSIVMSFYLFYTADTIPVNPDFGPTRDRDIHTETGFSIFKTPKNLRSTYTPDSKIIPEEHKLQEIIFSYPEEFSI